MSKLETGTLSGFQSPLTLEPGTLCRAQPAQQGIVASPSCWHTQEGKASLSQPVLRSDHRCVWRSTRAFQKLLGCLRVVVSLSPAVSTCPLGLPPQQVPGPCQPCLHHSRVSSQAHPQRPARALRGREKALVSVPASCSSTSHTSQPPSPSRQVIGSLGGLGTEVP